jgi:hypothetical protein
MAHRSSGEILAKLIGWISRAGAHPTKLIRVFSEPKKEMNARRTKIKIYSNF